MYIVYKTTNIINGMTYIGYHKVDENDDNLDPYYIGCGVSTNRLKSTNREKTHFQRAVAKYGAENFKREVLWTFDNLQDALDLERWLVYPEYVKDPNNYNMVVGGITGEDLSKAVYIYDLKGELVKECHSRSDAALFIYGKSSRAGSITKAIERGDFCKKMYQVYDYKYPFVKDYTSKMKEKYNKMASTINNKYTEGRVLNFANKKEVLQLDTNGNVIKVWESLNQCRKAGFTNVQAVIEGRRNSCKGYIFKYKEDCDIV